MPDAPLSFCTNCGAHLEPDAHFCGACGHVRAGAEAAPPGSPGVVPVPAAPAGGGRAPLLIAIGALAVAILLVTVGAVVFVVTRPDGAASADELVLEPVAFQTPDPFTPSVATGTEAPPAANVVKVTPTSQSPGGQQVPGAQPALYGGTKNNATCNPDQLVGFLQGNPDKAAAWAGVLGIATTDIAGYVRGLTPTLLTRDTRVTNHGFANGRATTISAVLQAGTAVLVDTYGVPRVKCGCGNPLTAPGPVTTTTKVRGTQWSGFSMATTVVVTVTVQVNVFVLVDVGTGQLYARPPGSSGKDDGDPQKDQVCGAFPTEPVCTTTTTTTTTTTAPTTTEPPPTTAPPPVVTPAPTPAPTSPSGDAAGTAIDIVQGAVASCPQGGALGQYQAIEIAAGVYRVTVPITFEGSTTQDVASFRVDLNAANHNLIAENTAAQWLTCTGN